MSRPSTSRPPGPRGLELLRAIAGRRTDPVRLLAELRNRYGDIVHVRVGDTSQFLLNDLAAVKHVLVDNHRNYTKGPAYELLASLLGRGLLTSEGDDWRRHRRIVQPALQEERMRLFTTVMVDAAAEEARGLERAARAGATVDVFALTMRLALRIVSRALLGAEVGDREADVHRAMTDAFEYMERRMVSGLRVLELLPGGSRLRGLRRRLSTLPTRRHREFTRAVATLDRVIYYVIEQRRRALATLADPRDLVSLLLLARDGDAEPLSAREVRDEVMTMFVAGHETTATALAWCLYLLATHPDHQRELARQADDVLGGREAELDDFARLTLARQAFEEAMRLYPPAWRISRFAVGADRIGEYDVPPGSVVLVSPYLIHRDPAHWDDPDRFEPGRFAPERSRDRPRLAFIPFGAGQRMCLGAAFATAEAQIILSVLCRRVTFEPVPGHVAEVVPSVTLRPKGGMPMRVRTRERVSDVAAATRSS